MNLHRSSPRTPVRKKKLPLLLAVAGCFSAFSPISQAGLFQDVTSDVGLINEAKKSWGNPIWGDINNDGFLDFIVPTHGLGGSRGPFVYLNNGGTTFTDFRQAAKIKAAATLDTKDWHGFAFGDYDRDGNLDVYIAEGAKSKLGGVTKRDLLYRGLGDGSFEYVSDLAAIVTSTDRGRCGFWMDYDNDGTLDLFVKNYGGSNRLYKNNGDSTFTERAADAGLADATQGVDSGSTCSFADYDNDGFVDVFFSGDKTNDTLYRNQGDGTFANVSSTAGMEAIGTGHGVAWGDYDNDGLLDMYVPREGTFAGTGGTLYHNNGDGTFSDFTAAAGISTTANSWAAVWGDYDNDGFLDLFATSAGTDTSGAGNANMLYRNNGDGTFTDLATQEGVTLEDNITLHKGAAWGDYNNDGFLDLLIKDGVGNERDFGAGATGLHRLFKNLGNDNHFIKVNLSGVQSNGHGIGTRVTVTSITGTSYRQNNGGGGGEFASQGSEPLHFGIGAATEATVEVKWPSGTIDTLSTVAADSTLDVLEGSAP